MTERDLSGGVPIEHETVVAEKPDEPFWSENLLFALYDPDTDIGFWLHLGSVPTEWAMWEDRVIGCFPGEGTFSSLGYYYTPQERKPAGPNLAFKCIEPFKRWKVTFDGFVSHTTDAEMQAGLAPDGKRQRMIIDLDIECATPVWDAHISAHSRGGKGEMTTQGWAKEHYEQLYRATGTVRIFDNHAPGKVAEKTHKFAGTGWRDHSRGPRGGGTGEPWGGHVISGCLFPSGKAFIFSSYWRPDGKITLEGANVYLADGTVHSAEVRNPPRLTELIMSGEKLPIELVWDGGEINLEMTTHRSIWTSMSKHLAVGKDLSGNGLMYVINFGPCEWDGEVGQVYIERSDPLNLPFIELKHREKQ